MGFDHSFSLFYCFSFCDNSESKSLASVGLSRLDYHSGIYDATLLMKSYLRNHTFMTSAKLDWSRGCLDAVWVPGLEC